MKLLTLCLLCVNVVMLGDTKPSEFKLTVTITYPSATLEEAAKIEKMLRKVVPDSCEVNLNLGPKVSDGKRFIVPTDSIFIQPRRWWYFNDSAEVPEILH